MNETVAEPCPHMRRALERLATGERGGLWLWYARLHTLKCNRCRRVLEAMKRYFQLVNPLQEINTDLDETWTQLSTALDEVDASKT